MNSNFIKLGRNEKTYELLKNHDAFILLTVIALRARRTDSFNIHNLKIGQAFIGDFKRCGFTRQRYRCAMKNLEKWQFVTIKSTTKGTIATLLDKDIYDINPEENNQQPNHQTTNKQPSANQQATTNKNDKNDNNDKNERSSPNSDEFVLSQLLLNLILSRKPDFKKPDLQRWASHINKLIRIDGREPPRIEDVIRFCQADEFWQNNILSTEKLRKHFDKLELDMAKEKEKNDSDCGKHKRLPETKYDFGIRVQV